MAYNKHQYATTLFLLSLVLTATNKYPSSLAQVQFLSGVRVTGRLCCTETGGCAPDSVPVPGANITVDCTDFERVRVVGHGTTDMDGRVSITVLIRLPPLAVDRPSVCNVTAPLPLNTTDCPQLSSSTGTLMGILGIVGTVVTKSGTLVDTVVTRGVRVDASG